MLIPILNVFSKKTNEVLSTILMSKNIYQYFLCCWLFTWLCINQAWTQARVQVRVLSIEAVNNEDCDGFFTGNSDFMWEFVATDNTLSLTNNNPVVVGGTLGGLFGGFANPVANIALVTGNNGPFTRTTPNNGVFNPANGLFFDHEYVCASDIPTAINLDWGAYEADEPLFGSSFTVFGRDGSTGIRNNVLSVPASGTSTPQTFTATGSGGGCNQTYRITLEVEVTPLVITPVEPLICDALPLTVGGPLQQFGWCGNYPLEPGEPHEGDFTNHGSGWFYFVAPASGQVRIETDLNETDFGTDLILYHAADGIGCVHGFNNWVGFPIALNPLKSKFDYLSYQGISRDDIIFTAGKATAHFSTIGNAFPGTPDGHALIAGEVYYIQLTTDDSNQRGYVSLRIDDLGGNPYLPHDIPCQGTDVTADAQSATVRTEANGQPFSTQLSRGTFFGGSRTSDEEIGSPYNGTIPGRFSAYDYVPATSNALNGSMWVQFTAAASGRIYFEADLDNALFNEVENTALYAPDPSFAPGLPSDLFCSNLNQIADADGGGLGSGANNTAIIMERCLEPGYTYYGMVDPSSTTTADEAEVWVYDPSVSDPANNPPPNDILCLALSDTLFRVPVKPANQTIPFSAVAGDNTNACIETLAGEPVSSPLAANRADQTVWHYFEVPPSGVIEVKLRAYIGLDSLNYAIYPLFQDSLCYGGLQPATYTLDGTQNTSSIQPIFSGTTGFNGDIFSICCLEPGTLYAIQLDGGSPGDEGQYIIEYINEVEVYAGDAQYSVNNDTFNFMSVDTGYVCYNDTLYPSVMLDPLGNTTTSIAGCLDIGFVVQDSMNIPDSIINGNFTFIDSVYARPRYWVNDGNNPISLNQVHYVSPMADSITGWGTLLCPSASAENGAAFVFLSEIIIADSYNPNNCIISFSITGGLPSYNGSLYDYVMTDAAGDTVLMGQVAAGVGINYSIATAGVFTITVIDGAGCGQTVVINATPCLDPCINNPVFFTPDPADSSVYTCYPGGDSALVTLSLNGGEPSITAGQNYTAIVSGSNTPNGNGTYTVAGAGTPTPTTFSFSVLDGDTWTVILSDSNGCLDTLSGQFDYNLTNCPDYCTLNPISSSFAYSCNSDGTALVQVTINGGQPSIDGSNYLVDALGSTVVGQTFQNVPVAGTIGGASNFSFLVNDGDVWNVVIFDNNNCNDTLTDGYTFDTSNCPICVMMPVQLFPNPVDSTIYNCNPDGTARVTLFLTGGAPSINTSLYTVTTSGSSIAGQNGTTTQDVGLYSFDINDGDSWSVIATDDNGCSDTLSGTFIYNSLNLDVNALPYVCSPNQTAVVTLQLSGGQPSIDGSNYLVTIVGTTGGGNSGYQVPVPGTIGDTSTYNFIVQNGDNWLAVVTDNSRCAIVDSIRGTFIWNPANCGNLCSDPNYNAITVEGLGGAITYDCDSSGNAQTTLSILGGLPDLTSAPNDYTALITINGMSNTRVLQGTGAGASLTLDLNPNDAWSVTVFDDLGCDTAVISDIFVGVQAIVNATTPPNMLAGQIATLDGSNSTGNINRYLWIPAVGVNDPSAPITTVLPLTSSYYTLEVSDTTGCRDTASVWIEVGPCIPSFSGFTPNGDGVNDLWEIPCLNLFANRVQVFNRWGQLVFEAENYDGTWDGTNMGQDLPDATYYYIIAVDDPLLDNPTIYKGNVTIIR
jgi:gliding motility-associated-like protein